MLSLILWVLLTKFLIIGSYWRLRLVKRRANMKVPGDYTRSRWRWSRWERIRRWHLNGYVEFSCPYDRAPICIEGKGERSLSRSKHLFSAAQSSSEHTIHRWASWVTLKWDRRRSFISYAHSDTLKWRSVNVNFCLILGSCWFLEQMLLGLSSRLPKVKICRRKETGSKSIKHLIAP